MTKKIVVILNGDPDNCYSVYQLLSYNRSSELDIVLLQCDQTSDRTDCVENFISQIAIESDHVAVILCVDHSDREDEITAVINRSVISNGKTFVIMINSEQRPRLKYRIKYEMTAIDPVFAGIDIADNSDSPSSQNTEQCVECVELTYEIVEEQDQLFRGGQVTLICVEGTNNQNTTINSFGPIFDTDITIKNLLDYLILVCNLNLSIESSTKINLDEHLW